MGSTESVGGFNDIEYFIQVLKRGLTMITVTYFGNLKDQLQCGSESIAWTTGNTDALQALLRSRGDAWSAALAPENIFRIVVNEEITFSAVEIMPGDRVAFLPPVTGG